ncbi:hypothetical protein BST61_g2084 [Cercospora zeina]
MFAMSGNLPAADIPAAGKMRTFRLEGPWIATSRLRPVANLAALLRLQFIFILTRVFQVMMMPAVKWRSDIRSRAHLFKKPSVSTYSAPGLGHESLEICQHVSRIRYLRQSQPDEYTGAILYLLSDASSFETGAAEIVDDGYTAWQVAIPRWVLTRTGGLMRPLSPAYVEGTWAGKLISVACGFG